MRVLVTAKAPVAGRVKTRLATTVGEAAAADLAAAALLDTIEACEAAVGASRCHLALDGDLGSAVRGEELLRAVAGWTVTGQSGEGFAARLVQAHSAAGDGPVVQIGMDTPQVTAAHLAEVFTELVGRDAVLGPAEDGGWWALARRDAAAVRPVGSVTMSSPSTLEDTRTALEQQGLDVGLSRPLRDVDLAEDAEVVAEQAPWTRFARTWREVRPSVPVPVPVPVAATTLGSPR